MSLRVRQLSLGVKIFALILMSTVVIILFILADSPLFAQGQLLSHLIRWQPYNKAYESMILGVNVVMGWMLWQASADPIRHRLMIAYGISANLIHAVIMFIFAMFTPTESLHAIGDVLFLGIPALVVLGLHYRTRDRSIIEG